MSNQRAKPDHLFVCCACGKTATTSYGFERVDGKDVSTARPGSEGWDESCAMHSREFPISRLVYSESGLTVVSLKDET